MALTLPAVKDGVYMKYGHFPTAYQCFIYRNWETVTPERMAEVLDTDTGTIIKSAEDMGLDTNIEVDPLWYEAGYITIIKHNWHLLTYDQICQLLGWNKDKLAYIIKEDDFLWVKLGNFKPDCPKLYYFPLDGEQRKKTEFIKKATLEMRNSMAPVTVKPFDFKKMFKRGAAVPQIKTPDKSRFDTRIVYSYCALYGDTFVSGMDHSFPDELLEAYAAIGVNGIWCQAVLYTVVPFPYMPELSEGYEARLNGLRALTAKMAKYGIKLYLYMNEPRSMPEDFFIKYPDLKGSPMNGFNSLCTSTPEIQKYLYDSARFLAEQVPALGGFITITASENQTHCYSHYHKGNISCPRCSKREKAEVIAEVNRILYEGAASVIPDFKLLAWTWSWDLADNDPAIDLMPPEIGVMAVSERLVEKVVGGIHTDVNDYSISVVGPGKYALDIWKRAREKGHKAYAKVQLNNTWECSSTPFIPVFEQVYKHMIGLIESGVGGLMLDWTLGGYPSLTFAMMKELFYDTGRIPSLEELYGNVFPADTVGTVKEAVRSFSEAFDKFPFHISTLYCGTQNVGPGNLLYPEKTGFGATMVCFPYDDLKAWRSIYPADVYDRLYKELTEEWAKGLETLKKLGFERIFSDPALNELYDTAEVSYCHFRSSYLQSRFVQLRDAGEDYSAVVDEEIEVTLRLADVEARNSAVGYESSNHYFYTRGALMEKYLCCKHIKETRCGK